MLGTRTWQAGVILTTFFVGLSASGKPGYEFVDAPPLQYTGTQLMWRLLLMSIKIGVNC